MTYTERLENIGKTLLNYSHISKAYHYFKNRSNKHAVFLWIPKNAGTSIYRTLKNYGCLKAKKIERVKYRFSQTGLVTFGHMDYGRLLEEGYISEKYASKAFVFCFSRNPYDRAVSLYEYFKGSLTRHMTFREFIQMIHEQDVHPIGLHNSMACSHCNPQVRWLEKQKPDFCGSYENLAEDFNKVLEELDLPGESLLHLNKSRRRRYTDYYDLETKRRVDDFYREDFEYFQYPYLDESLFS